jgi:hypothetical protein
MGQELLFLNEVGKRIDVKSRYRKTTFLRFQIPVDAS